MSCYSKVCQALGSKHVRPTAVDDSRVDQEQLPGRAPPSLVLRPSCRLLRMQGALSGGQQGTVGPPHPASCEGGGRLLRTRLDYRRFVNCDKLLTAAGCTPWF